VRDSKTSRAWIAAASLATLSLSAPTAAVAQLPAGVQIPGSLSKDSLLSQAKAMVADLTLMKSSGKLAPDQIKQVDTLLPKAQSLTGELEKPQVDAAKLPQLASNLKDLQQQVGMLKGLLK